MAGPLLNDPNDPAVYKRRLRSELRKARERLGMSQKDAAAAMDWSLSKIIRIEAGTVSISINDLRALLTHYQIQDSEQVDALVDIARKARERSPWWAKYKPYASSELLSYCAYESSAKIVRNFEPLLVPGLLQTEDYARTILRTLRGSKDPQRINHLVELRLQRQDILSMQDGRKLHFIMDEAVIRRAVGGPTAMRRQLTYLRDLASRPGISIRVIPFLHGMYRGLRVPYTQFEFSDPQDESILYLENPQGESIIFEQDADVGGDTGQPTPTVYLEVFWELEQAATREQSLVLIEQAISSMPVDVSVRPQVDLTNDESSRAGMESDGVA